MSVSSLEGMAQQMLEIWSQVFWMGISVLFFRYLEKTASRFKIEETKILAMLSAITVYLIMACYYSIGITKNGAPLLTGLGALIIWAGWRASQGWNKTKSANESHLG